MRFVSFSFCSRTTPKPQAQSWIEGRDVRYKTRSRRENPIRDERGYQSSSAPRCLQVGPRCLQTTSRSLFVGSSRCQDGQHGIQKPPKVLIMASRGTRDGLYKWKKVALATAKATCLLLQALGPLGVLYASKRSQDNLKMAPRWLKLA